MAASDSKQGNFGGLPGDELDKLMAKWATTARPAALTDAQWIAQLVDKVQVLSALAKEEHAAANASASFDIVSVVMKAMAVSNANNAATLVGALGDLEKAWGQ